jgi:chromosome segregation ATPase
MRKGSEKMADVSDIEEKRKELENMLEEIDNQIKSLQNRIIQLEREKVSAMRLREKIKDDLTCHAKLCSSNVEYRCKLEIGHKGGHSFEVGAYTYTVIEDEQDED